MTAIVAHDTLRRASAAGRVEDVERVGRRDWHAVRREPARLCVSHEARPVVVAALLQFGRRHRALKNDAALGLVGRDLDGLVEKRLVGDDTGRLHAARRRHDHLGLGIVEALGKLVAGEAAEHDRVDRAEPRRGEHGDYGLRHHGHIDDDAVAFGDAKPGKNGREGSDLVAKLGKAVCPLGVGDGAVVDQRGRPAPPRLDVAVEAIVGRVAQGARKPAPILAGAVIEHLVARLEPIDGGSGFGPESLRVGLPLCVDLVVPAHRIVPLPRAPLPAAADAVLE